LTKKQGAPKRSRPATTYWILQRKPQKMVKTAWHRAHPYHTTVVDSQGFGFTILVRRLTPFIILQTRTRGELWLTTGCNKPAVRYMIDDGV